jgi:hypothetical protein
MMLARVVGIAVIAGALAIGVTAARAESKGCAEIVAASEESGGKLSADELAKKMNTDVQTVRHCLDAKAPAPKAAGAEPSQMK